MARDPESPSGHSRWQGGRGMNATHGWSCNSVTWLTKCPRCRDSVFFFQVTVRRVPDNFSIDSGIVSRAQRRTQQRDPIVAINPDHDSGQATVVGVLREKKIEVDIETSLDLPQNSSMVWSFLGPLARGRWGKVTIHKQSADEDVLHSYTALVSSETLDDVRNSTGVTVMAELSAFSVPQIGTFWICDTYEVL